MIKRILLLIPLWLVVGLFIQWIWTIQIEPYTVESIGILSAFTGILVVFGVLMSVELKKDLLKQEVSVKVKTQIQMEIGDFSLIKDWCVSNTDKRLVVITSNDELYSVYTTDSKVVKILKL